MKLLEDIFIYKVFIINWLTNKNSLFLRNGFGISIKGFTNNNVISNKPFFITKNSFEITNNGFINPTTGEWIRNVKVVQPNINIVDFQKNTLYVLLYSQKISHYKIYKKYFKWIINKIPIIITKKTDTQLLFHDVNLEKYGNYIEFCPTTTESLLDKIIFIIAILIICSLVFYANYRLTYIYELKDPLLSKFMLPSCNIMKYNKLQNKDSMQTCVICFDEFKELDVVRLLKCNHFFHLECVDKWLIAHLKKCPCCRINIEVIEKDSSDEVNV